MRVCYRTTATVGVEKFLQVGIVGLGGMTLSGYKTPSVYTRYNIIDAADLTNSMRRVQESVKNSQRTKRVVPIKTRNGLKANSNPLVWPPKRRGGRARLKALDSKSSVRGTVPGVRIPPSPPTFSSVPA